MDLESANGHQSDENSKGECNFFFDFEKGY